MAETDQYAYERAALNELISELRENKRIHQPTKMELVLQIFIDNLGGVVLTSMLLPIYEGSLDADRQVRGALTKINYKLEPKGVQLRHIPGYGITRIPRE